MGDLKSQKPLQNPYKKVVKSSSLEAIMLRPVEETLIGFKLGLFLSKEVVCASHSLGQSPTHPMGKEVTSLEGQLLPNH